MFEDKFIVLKSGIQLIARSFAYSDMPKDLIGLWEPYQVINRGNMVSIVPWCLGANSRCMIINQRDVLAINEIEMNLHAAYLADSNMSSNAYTPPDAVIH